MVSGELWQTKDARFIRKRPYLSSNDNKHIGSLVDNNKNYLQKNTVIVFFFEVHPALI